MATKTQDNMIDLDAVKGSYCLDFSINSTFCATYAWCFVLMCCFGLLLDLTQPFGVFVCTY